MAINNGFVNFRALSAYENDRTGNKGEMWVNAMVHLREISGVLEYINNDGEKLEGCELLFYSGLSLVCATPYETMKDMIFNYNPNPVHAFNN